MKYETIELHNVCDVFSKPEEEGFRITRLPLAIHDKINQGAKNNSTLGAACEIRGMLPEGGQAKVVLQTMGGNIIPPIAEVYHGCFSSQAVLVSEEAPTEITITKPPKMPAMERISKDNNLPFDPHLVRVCLPHLHPVQIISIEGLTYPEPGSTPSQTVLSYGSSITHGAHAIPPMGTYASQCATRLGYDLINLGVGGSAQMDPPIAEHIAAREDWDIATFEMGINVRSMWQRDEFHAAVDKFVSTVVSAHPDKYVFCIDLFTNDQDFEAEPTLAVGFREAVREVAAKFDSDKVIYVDGRDILPNPTGLRIDLVHPTDNGMQEMGRNLADLIARTLKED